MKRQQITSSDDTEPPIITESGGRLGYYYLNIFIFTTVSLLSIRYNQNPTLIGVLIGILVFLFLPINYVEYVFADNNKLVVLYKRVFFLQFLNRKRTFKYDEIKKITATLKNDEKTDITAFIIDLTTKFTAMSFNVLEVRNEKRKNKIY